MVSWKQTLKAVTQPAFLYMVIMTLGAMMFGVSVETFIFFGLITGFFIAAKSYQEKIPVNMVFGGFLLLFTVSLAISHFAGVTLPFAAQPYQQAGLSGASDWGSLIGPIAIAGLVGAITGWIRGNMREVFEAARMLAPALAIIGAVGMILAGISDYIATMKQFPLLKPLIPSGMKGTIWASAIFAGGGISFYTTAIGIAFLVAAAGMQIFGP